MNDAQRFAFDLSAKELSDCAQRLRDMIRMDEVNLGAIASIRDIVTRFVVPRLEDVTR
jgi:hypothetical protein